MLVDVMRSEDLIDIALEKVARLGGKPAAIECYWDGDTRGWYLVLVAIVERPSRQHPRYSECDLLILSEGTDIRIFNSMVPPWPEAEIGAAVGEALARKLGVPFSFPARQEPTDTCERWWETER